MPSYLSDVWETVKRTLREMPSLDESNTKMRVITPLLYGLGWDIYGGEVQTEYEIPYGVGRVKVDYAIFLDGKPKIFVEAKGLNIELNDDHATQAISYAKSRDVGWCVVTNGRQIRIYNAGWGTEPKNTLFEVINLEPDKDPPQRLHWLSKDFVSSGELDNLGRESRFSQTIRARLSSTLLELESRWLREASNRVYAAVKGELQGVTRKQVWDAIRPILKVAMVEPVEAKGVHKPPMQVRTIDRQDLVNLPDGLVVICPGKKAGVEWMKRHNAWGFKRIGKRPDFFALYVSEDVREVRYLARVKDVVEPDHPDSPVRDFYLAEPHYKPGKKVILFEEGSLMELPLPIPAGRNPKKVPQNLAYCRLDDLRHAQTLDDI